MAWTRPGPLGRRHRRRHGLPCWFDRRCHRQHPAAGRRPRGHARPAPTASWPTCRRALGLPTRTAAVVVAHAVDGGLARQDRRGRRRPKAHRGCPALLGAAVARLHPASTGPGDPVALASTPPPSPRPGPGPGACSSPGWPTSPAPARGGAGAVDGRRHGARWLAAGSPGRRAARGRLCRLSPVVADAVDLVVTAAADAGAGGRRPGLLHDAVVPRPCGRAVAPRAPACSASTRASSWPSTAPAPRRCAGRRWAPWSAPAAPRRAA